MEEKMRILKMLEEGKVTAEEAANLLAAFEEPKEIVSAGAVGDYDKRMLHIVVDGEDKVKVNFPVRLAKKILKATGKLPVNIPEANMSGADVSQLMDTIAECLDDEMLGEIVSVESKDGERVRVVIE